ncbi:hypothetical protein QFC21_005990 [Naganishia friedmannii]|uniref:Uncharacterized protein n=1 Tax=Naganishia friedmannii TaxID=89922 RepID=A0ACC2V6Z9_9TREE|nr:hypothetical protein QFC21_005990 [Naganishia friedmannii]
MPAFKLSSLLQKDKGSRRSSVASETSSITSEPDVSSPLDSYQSSAAASDRVNTFSDSAVGARESGAANWSHTSDNTTRGLTLDTSKANLGFNQPGYYSSDDNLDTPLASKNEADLFQVRSRSSTKGSNNGPSAHAILTQPITVDGLGPALPTTVYSGNTVTPAQAIVIATQSTPPSGNSSEHTPSAAAVPAFAGQPMQSTLSSPGNTLQPNHDVVTAPRSPGAARTALTPPTTDTSGERRFSSSSKRPNPLNLVPGNAGTPLPTGSSLAPPTSSAQSVMSLPMPSTAASHQPHHDYPTSVPAEILSKVKSKVKGHRSSKDSESLNGAGRERKMGKRERLKSRLRASSDAFSTRSANNNGNAEEYTDSMGDESDTSEGSESDVELDGVADYDDDSRSVATRSSYYSRASIPVHGFAVASNKRNLEFHALFPEIDEGDYLIEDYGCALQKDILLQGRIYVSEHHLSFHANIFGWITNVIIAFADVIAIEKKMTAFVIPNAISISTRQGKNYTFASFISRDSTYDVFINVWRQSHSRSPSIQEHAGDGISTDSGPDVVAQNGGAAAKSAVAAHKPTVCACGQKGDHYTEVALETVLPSTPEKVYNLMFASSFLKDWMVNNQKLLDIQMGDWTPQKAGSDLLKRQMSYIKPLNGSIGPKQTKCEIADENEHVDYDQYICNITTTRTPDVPSGNAFSVKTRTCLMWNGANSTKVVVTTKVEFTARSFIKGIIEKSAIDGQKQYHNALEQSMREYMKEHASEFAVQGADGKPIPETEEADETSGNIGATNVEKSVLVQPDVAAARRKKEEEDASAFQYALDRIITGGKALGSGVWALVRWFGDIIGGLPFGKDFALVLVIGFLIASNLWTYKALKGSKPARVERRERRAAQSDTTPIGASPVELQQMVDKAVNQYFKGSAESVGLGEASAGLGSYTAAILQELNALENRIIQIRTGVVTADVVGEAGMVNIQEGQHPVSGAMDTLE